MAARLRRLALLSAFVSAAVLAGTLSCGDDDTTAPDEPFTGTIRVLDNRFSPASVTIATGDSVTWSWQGSGSHSVTQGTTLDPSEDPSRLFDEGPKSSGTFGYRFTAAGTVPYFCRPHFNMGMKGTITVQ